MEIEQEQQYMIENKGKSGQRVKKLRQLLARSEKGQ